MRGRNASVHRSAMTMGSMGTAVVLGQGMDDRTKDDKVEELRTTSNNAQMTHRYDTRLFNWMTEGWGPNRMEATFVT